MKNALGDRRSEKNGGKNRKIKQKHAFAVTARRVDRFQPLTVASLLPNVNARA